MTPASFSVLVTPRFERDLRKLLKSHADVLALYARDRDPCGRSHPAWWSNLGRLAIDHPLRALAVTGSFHRYFGCGSLNVAEILFAEFDRCCRDVLPQPM